MKTYDFTFVYEVKNRELENMCLIAYELERRGYTVKFVETWDSIFHSKPPISTRVTVGFAMYTSQTLNFIKSFVRDCNKFVNMQWEQIFSNADASSEEQKNGSVTRGITGKALEACHMSWGKVNYERLRNIYGVPEENVRIVGHTALDFLRPEFNEYYLKKDELFKRYSIPTGKKVCLFISSFAYSGLPESMLQSELYQNQSRDVNEFVRISVKTQDIVLDWIEKLLASQEDYIFVYRPHPAENDNDRLKEMVNKYENFYLIGELSIKQWIKCVDKIYTWFSTAIAEVYGAGKNCEILRPIQIPFDSDVEIYNGARYLTSYEEFCRSLEVDNGFPILTECFQRYYYTDKNIPAYVKVCDFLEDIYSNDKYKIEVEYEKPLSLIRRIRYNVYVNLIRCKKIRKIIHFLFQKKKEEFNEEEFLYSVKMSKANHTSDREIIRIKNKIRRCLEGIGRI